MSFPVAFFKTAILKFLSATSEYFEALSSVVAELLVSFGGDIFSWFFMFLVSLCCCFCIWSSRPLLKSLLVAFRRYWYWSLVLLYEGFPRFLNGWTSSTLLVQACRGTLVFLLVPRVHQSGCWKSLFCFLEGSIIYSSNCNFSLTCTPWSTLLRILQLLGLLSLPACSGACHRMGGGVGLALGDAHRPSREIPEWYSQRLVGRLPAEVLKQSAETVLLSCPWYSCLLPSPPLPFLPSWKSRLWTAGAAAEKQVSPGVTPTVGTAHCFPRLHVGGCPLQPVLGMYLFPFYVSTIQLLTRSLICLYKKTIIQKEKTIFFSLKTKYPSQ